MIIVTSMLFHSVESPSSRPEANQSIQKRSKTYRLVLSRFEGVFSALSKYKLYFSEKVDGLGNFGDNSDTVTLEADGLGLANK